MNIELVVSGITEKNKYLKMHKAVRVLSQRLGVPIVRKQEHNHGGKEPFIFQSHEDLVYKWYNYFSAALDAVYNFVTGYFGLPEVRIVSKAGELRHEGKIVYNPETGEPIKQSEWDSFVKLLEKFLNRKIKDADKKIILDSKALGRILNRMLKYNRYDEVTSLPLDDIKYRGKTLDWISDSVKNMRTALGEGLGRSEMARIQVLQMSAAERITRVSDQMKSDIKQILIDGVIARKGKSQISQEIYDKMAGHNRDFQRIADTEIQNSINNSYLLDEARNAEPGEKIYFQRIEAMDQNTCPFCRRMNGKIALWSDHPLDSDRIDDPVAEYAIWDGKNWNGKKEFVATGVFHPWCRGTWAKYGGAIVDALVAHLKNQSKLYNKALDQARAEYKARGIENPNDKTPGFTVRINELYRLNIGEKPIEKSFDEGKHPRGGNGQFSAVGGGGREPWDSSTGKAGELRAEDWGTPGEIAEMARMERQAKNSKEAEKALKDIASRDPLKSKSGIMASLSGKTIGKIISGKALETSFDKEAHWQAAANADKLFENAIEPWDFEMNPDKGNQGLKSRRYLYAPMEHRGRIVPVKFTVKEYSDINKGKRIYSLEAIDVNIEQKNKGVGMLTNGVLEKSSALGGPSKRPCDYNIAHVFDSVNAYLTRIPPKNYTDRVFKALYGEIAQKSLTWSGHKLQGRYKFAGFDISVENKAGSTRSGIDKDGHEWQCKMYFDYGYIRGSVGVDGDHVDVYIGPDESAAYVYVVHQNDPVTGKYDEDKVMLGFPSLKAARTAYLKQYDRPGFLGDVDIFPLEVFREKVLSKRGQGQMIKSYSERVQEALGRTL